MFGLLGACARDPTPYQPAVDGYGYSEQRIENNRFWVTFEGNDFTKADTVQKYLLYHAAELTLNYGYDYFTVVDRNMDRSNSLLWLKQHERDPRLHHGGRRLRRRP